MSSVFVHVTENAHLPTEENWTEDIDKCEDSYILIICSSISMSNDQVKETSLCDLPLHLHNEWQGLVGADWIGVVSKMGQTPDRMYTFYIIWRITVFVHFSRLLWKFQFHNRSAHKIPQKGRKRLTSESLAHCSITINGSDL